MFSADFLLHAYDEANAVGVASPREVVMQVIERKALELYKVASAGSK
jgi:hypothetical protein